MKKLALLCITISSLSGSTSLLCSYNFSPKKFANTINNPRRFENHNGARDLAQTRSDSKLVEARNLNNYSPTSYCSSPTNLNKQASPTKYVPGLHSKQLTEKELRTLVASLTTK